MISSELCVRCKGKLLCGLSYCPILRKYSAQIKASKNIASNFLGYSPPSLFISWYNYPKVSVYPLSTPESIRDVSLLDKPERWYGLSAERIIEFRSSLVMAGKKFHAKNASDPSYELIKVQELAMSTSHINVEVELVKKPEPKLSFSSFAGPLGLKAPLRKLELESNPKVPRKVDYLVSDIDVKANDALLELYGSGFPVSFLHRLLSAGLLGVEKNRRIVPTRWAITAVDANISKTIISEKIKGYEIIDRYELYHSNYLENDFWVLLIPSIWAFEQLECWLPGSVWLKEGKAHIIENFEDSRSVADYRKVEDGAYYAARLAVAEFLESRRRQAACIFFREISPRYVVPLGVWQVRENIRHALKQRPICFETLNEALEYLKRKLVVPIREYIARSKLIDWIKKQKRLSEFS